MLPLNTPMQTMIEQAEANLRRGLPLFVQQPENRGTALIVGGGPSLQDSLPNLRMKWQRGGIVFALNGAHDWLIDRGIRPDFHVLLDARRENSRFVQAPRKEVTYLVAAQCHGDVFEALAGQHVIVWVACLETAEQEQELGEKFPELPISTIGGGSTVGLKAANLAYLWGFRDIQFYGLDSSYADGENHAYRQAANDQESRIEVHAAGRDFICAPWMAKQADEFQQQQRQLTRLGCRIKVHGDGLIPHIAKHHEKEHEHA